MTRFFHETGFLGGVAMVGVTTIFDVAIVMVDDKITPPT